MGSWLPFWIIGAPSAYIVIDWILTPKSRSFVAPTQRATG